MNKLIYMAQQNKVNIVIYHKPCPDGEMSAAIFRNKYKKSKFIPWTHGDSNKTNTVISEIQKISEMRHIFFLDVCPEFSFVVELKDNVLRSNDKISILDHHMAACNKFQKDIEESDKSYENLEIIFDNNRSGCQLTWNYLHPDKEYPRPVYYIGNKDLYKWDDPNTEPFTNGYPDKFYIKLNANFILRIKIYEKILNLTEDEIELIILKGIDVTNTMIGEAIEIISGIAFVEDTDINGKELKIIELEMEEKYYLTKYIKLELEKRYPDYDVLRIIYLRENRKDFSLRSLKDDIRVDLLAQKYGGNGHMKASGYSQSFGSVVES